MACCFSEITKNTGDEERGKILARVMMGRQIGLIVGPTANFIFLNLDTKIKIGNWNWELNNLTAPGLLMTGLWFFLEIFILLFYKNLNKFYYTQPPVSARVERNEDSEATSLLNNNENEIEIDNKYKSFAQNSFIINHLLKIACSSVVDLNELVHSDYIIKENLIKNKFLTQDLNLALRP